MKGERHNGWKYCVKLSQGREEKTKEQNKKCEEMKNVLRAMDIKWMSLTETNQIEPKQKTCIYRMC